MSITISFGKQMDRLARRLGYRVFPDWVLHPSQLLEIDALSTPRQEAPSPPGAAEYLHQSNPRLQEFRRIHAASDEDVRTPLIWTEKLAETPTLATFRGDNVWVNQVDSHSLHHRAYVLATYYALFVDRLGLMESFTEDGAFGALIYEIAGRPISRDLLDSVLEMNFLDRHLSLRSQTDLSILDIGAGYGRLAHRMLSAFPQLSRYYCADVIAESSFVCEYYLRFRGLGDRAELLSASEVDRALSSRDVGLAINIHSFSECTLKAVHWWLNRLAQHGVKYLMIAPNAGNHGGQLLLNNIGQDMLPVIEANGYRLLAREAKYSDPAVQKFAMNPTYYWLFQLKK